MKKNFLFTVLFAALMLVILLPGHADAASLKMKKLKAGKTYKINLNGGKKEKVKYTVKEISDSTQRFTLYVNKKAVYTKVLDEWSVVNSVKTVDFISKDKYKEILVDIGGGYSNWWVFVLRYVSPKKVIACTEFTNVKGKMCPLDISRIDSGVYKNTGKNKLYLQNDTPFRNENFGCYHILAPIKLKSGKMKAVAESKYKLTGVKDYTESLFGGKYYKLKKEMVLYKSASFKKELKTLEAGDTFVPTYIKPLKPESKEVYDDTVYGYPLFVKVKDAEGTTGWLYFPPWSSEGYSSEYLTATPAWG
ncbi:MAG: hypothetical protein IJJ25_11080 [Lachnospiraceae bacterium]|nr:hypothetical protein [Lachnospiraceae bacterium]